VVSFKERRGAKKKACSKKVKNKVEGEGVAAGGICQGGIAGRTAGWIHSAYILGKQRVWAEREPRRNSAGRELLVALRKIIGITEVLPQEELRQHTKWGTTKYAMSAVGKGAADLGTEDDKMSEEFHLWLSRRVAIRQGPRKVNLEEET